MTEGDAKDWIESRWGSAAVEQLAEYVALLSRESAVQNLIARSTFDSVWVRHILDSAQLVQLAADLESSGEWIDIGAGAGLPGIVAAVLQQRHLVMVEPRRRRVAFLETVVGALRLDASVVCARIENVVRSPAAVISARAVATLETLFDGATAVSGEHTLWVLPKGRSAASEVEAARKTWQGLFHVEQSITQSDSMIVVARRVSRR